MDPQGAPRGAANHPPGGYPPGHPGGDGPPGGGGYGPPGSGGHGPPGGGGYGPPGGGGYGPPGGGGYGPPGGGYGPPGGGGYGPPGGGGQPPQGFGAPPPGGFHGPPAREPPKRSHLALILGVGCGAVFLVCILVGAALLYYASSGKGAGRLAELPAPLPPEAPASGLGAPGDAGPAPVIRAEIRDLRSFPASAGKLHHVLGEIHNTGTAPIGSPSAKVTLYGAGGVALETGLCAAQVRLLPPGEKVPCAFLAQRPAAQGALKAEIAPAAPSFRGELAKLSIADTKFTPRRGQSPHRLEGRITNESAFVARSVVAIVSLHGADGKIVGMSHVPVAGGDLAPSASGLFAASIVDVADAPATWQVLAVGYSE
ncbi:hypothetical protein [Sorangium sp. So ce131]|uniref:hypothetical protein n=1 Tax=Sorangium sp. So ce131 TaxID=3133282 RepID=UPI003F6404DF